MVFRGRTVALLMVLALAVGGIGTAALNGGTSLSSLFSARTLAAVFGSAGASASSNHPSGSDAQQASSVTADPKQDARGLTDAEEHKLETAFNLIENKYVLPIDRQKLIDGAIHGMVEALDDPFTSYINAEDAEKFSQSVDSYFTGIGAEVSLENGHVTVMAPIKGSPAAAAGIRAKDAILSVNGESLDGLSLEDAVTKIRGPKGTQAKLEILRPGQHAPMEIIVVRGQVDIETVYAKMLDNQIGLIEIRQFSLKTKDRFADELKTLEAKGMKGLIIDVRSNPGGYLYDALDIIQPFIAKGKTMVELEDRAGDIQKMVSQGTGRPYPVAVLVNEGSASASEILAAGLRESAGAALIGTKTFGKGTVQDQFEKDFNDGSVMKMTIAKWLTPNGNWIHHKGLTPDIDVSQPDYFNAAPLPKDKVLKQDMNGEDVANLQLILKGLSLDPGRSDGYFDRKTAQAVSSFQSGHGLSVTGEVDEKTATVMEQAVVAVMQDAKNDAQLQRAIQYMQQQQKPKS